MRTSYETKEQKKGTQMKTATFETPDQGLVELSRLTWRKKLSGESDTQMNKTQMKKTSLSKFCPVFLMVD